MVDEAVYAHVHTWSTRRRDPWTDLGREEFERADEEVEIPEEEEPDEGEESDEESSMQSLFRLLLSFFG